jgi:hypothetical protein
MARLVRSIQAWEVNGSLFPSEVDALYYLRDDCDTKCGKALITFVRGIIAAYEASDKSCRPENLHEILDRAGVAGGYEALAAYVEASTTYDGCDERIRELREEGGW